LAIFAEPQLSALPACNIIAFIQIDYYQIDASNMTRLHQDYILIISTGLVGLYLAQEQTLFRVLQVSSTRPYIAANGAPKTITPSTREELEYGRRCTRRDVGFDRHPEDNAACTFGSHQRSRFVGGWQQGEEPRAKLSCTAFLHSSTRDCP
jgi:hypothetical protein